MGLQGPALCGSEPHLTSYPHAALPPVPHTNHAHFYLMALALTCHFLESSSLPHSDSFWSFSYGLSATSSEKPSQLGRSLSHHPALFSPQHILLDDSYLFICLLYTPFTKMCAPLMWAFVWFSAVAPGPGTVPAMR